MFVLDIVKEGGRAPPIPSPGWADFYIMMESTQESDHFHALCVYSVVQSQYITVGPTHRVGRVLSFFSMRWNRDSPNPSPARECASPPPFGSGGGAHSLVRERAGESQFQRGGHTLW